MIGFLPEKSRFRPALTCTGGGKAEKCRSMKVIYVTSPIGAFQEKPFIREINGKTCTDLHPHTDGNGKRREREVERRLVEEVRKRGGKALKFVSPGHGGVPDRIVLLPHGRMGFVEVKAPGEKPRPLQVRVFGWLRKLGFIVEVVDSETDIREALDGIQGT